MLATCSVLQLSNLLSLGIETRSHGHMALSQKHVIYFHAYLRIDKQCTRSKEYLSQQLQTHKHTTVFKTNVLT